MADPESLRTIMGTARRVNKRLGELLLADEVSPPVQFIEEAGIAVLTFRPKKPEFIGHRRIALEADEISN